MNDLPMHPIPECLRLFQINRDGPATVSCAECVRCSSPCLAAWSTPPSMRPRSHLGQTQKSECATGKSALPSRTDVASRACQVRKVPISEVAPLFNRLVDRREQEGTRSRASAALFSLHPPQSPLLREKRNPPTAIDRARLMIISAFAACCCLMMGYPRLAVPSLRSIRLRTELTIARRTNAISEWAFRRRNVRRHAPCAATLPSMRRLRCARASQPPRRRRSLPADSETRTF